MSDEPEYLRRLRQSQGARSAKPAAAQPEQVTGTIQEEETLRWAREVAAGEEIRSIRHLRGARFAVLVRLQSVTGTKMLSLEGLNDRDTLRERVKPGATVGEEVLGAYEVKGGRPVTIAIEESQVVLKMGEPRPGAHPVSPEKMLRLAAKDAAKRAKERPRDGDRGGRGRGR
jgi:hypothetical protein